VNVATATVAVVMVARARIQRAGSFMACLREAKPAAA
jgi:hypothetical protein